MRRVSFRYLKGSIVFDFAAERSLPGGTITGTYCISLTLEPSLLRGVASRKIAVEEIVTDIDSALRAWPIPSDKNDTPIGISHFTVTIEGQIDGRFTHLDCYRLLRGQPVVLQRAPASSRWTPKMINRDCAALVKDDGVEIIVIPDCRGRSGRPNFRYCDPSIAFDFGATRRLSRDVPTDTWEVQLDPPHLQGLSASARARLGTTQCAATFSNIEEALYAWPPNAGYDIEKTPINRVVFLDANFAL